MTSIYIIGAAVLALWMLKKKNSPEQIGRVKFYKALEEAQKWGIEFGSDKTTFTDREKMALDQIGKENGYKQSSASRKTGKPYYQVFYNYLNNKYKAVAGIGKFVAPYTEYKVRNENGDVVIIFNDYDENNDVRDAIDKIDQYIINPQKYGEMYTYAYIYDGGKFVWESKFKGGTTSRLTTGMKDELFGSGRSKVEMHPQEKKKRRKIIASEEKGGVYPEKFAERIASEAGIDDSHYVRNGVLEALRNCSSPDDAKRWLLDEYYKDPKFHEPDHAEPDSPF